MNGIINVYKEPEYTSFDVVAILRGILKQKKIGHTGTLDPMAEGVLPVCLGSATKLCELLTDHDKEYEAVMRLGVTYDTLDIWGEKLTENKIMSTESEVVSAIKSFEGGYNQTPPMYSAKKVDGKKLYDLAREGKTIERKSVFVNIYNIDILSIDFPRVKIKVSCGKGTYIRSLIDDIGRLLGCGAAMESLVRTKVNEFTIDNALTLKQIEELTKKNEIEDYIKAVDLVFSNDRRVDINSRLCKLVENGNKLIKCDFENMTITPSGDFREKEKLRIYDSDGIFRAVYEYNAAKGELKPYKMFL